MNSLITNIQRMCFQDGPGIRTTIFLKGCTIRCPWCSNPENICFEAENYNISADCVLKYPLCRKDACDYYGRQCSAVGVYGKSYSKDELIKKLIEDETYYRQSGGGVTFSGGEPLAHLDALLPVMRSLKERGVHLAIETALFVPKDKVIRALNFVDFIYVDVKILKPESCMEILGGNVETFLANVDAILQSDKDIIFRVPCNDTYTLKNENMDALLDFFRDKKEVPIEIFKTHNLGEKKFRSLGLTVEKSIECSDKRFEFFFQRIKEQGNIVTIQNI